jgi:predicted transcriptional regulator
MRTTVELRDEQRARLLEIAARRGEKGFSRLLQEAVDRYLDELEAREERVRDALAVVGTLDEEGARHLRSTVTRLRSSWR